MNFVVYPSTDGAARELELLNAFQAAQVRVVRRIAGNMLVEGTKAEITAIAAQHDWLVTAERKTARVPERTALERAKNKKG